MKSAERLGIAAVSVALLLAFWPTATQAEGLQITPLSVTLKPLDRAGSLTIANHETAAKLFQLRVQAWHQSDGTDQLTPTDDLLAVPPIFKLAPGATQVIRVGVRQPPQGVQEQTYRLFIAEVPSKVPGTNAIQFVLNFSVPVFVLPPGLAAPKLEWSAQKIGDRRVRLTVTNGGNAHALIARVRVHAGTPTRDPLHEAALHAYLLAGQARSWTIELRQPIAVDALNLEVLAGGKTSYTTTPLKLQ